MKKLIVLGIALCLVGGESYGQSVKKVIAGRAGMYPSFVSFAEGAEPAFVPGTVLLKQEDAFMASTATVLVHSEKDQLKMEHFRYQQKINNIPVEGAVYVVHVRDGKVKGYNGDWIATDGAGLVSAPSLNECAAQKNAMAAFGAVKYKWQLPEEEAFIKKESGDATASFRPKMQLVYYSGEDRVNIDRMRLAWKIDLYAHEPIGRRIYFIDAENGSVLGMREVLHTGFVTGTATTGYSGSQNITTEQTSATSYRLHGNGRGSGVNTYNLNKTSNYGNASDFLDGDNIWNNVTSTKDQYATDAHWGAEQTYDFYSSTFGRNSIDDNGHALNSYVHYSRNYYNAFWDGTRMTYGDGNSSNGFRPLTALDVCGHEITHGLTQHTADLIYSNESGALNEGFSDVLGTAIEFFAKPGTANWDMGEDIGTIRSMSNPNQFGQPDTYKGTNWATGGADYGGVHTNSGVLNYWFYLLSMGGSGTNDKGFSYTVNGIGEADAAAIAYRTLTAYLTPSSKYIDARTLSIQAATDLFEISAPTKIVEVANAWDAVNVTEASANPPVCADNYEANDSRTAAASITVNTDITGRIGTSTDKDWFKFSTTPSETKLKLSLTNLPEDYDVRLYDSKGKQIGISQNGGSNSESISYNAGNGASTYYVQVYGYNGANSPSCYLLYVTISNVNQLDDDPIGNQNSLVKANGEAINDNEIVVFPNPAKDKLSVNFSSETAGKINLSITDYVGRVVMQEQFDAQAGGNTITLPLKSYSPGIYFLNAAGKQSAKFQITE
jgi:bacillolysin